MPFELNFLLTDAEYYGVSQHMLAQFTRKAKVI
jgi:hypothetical protein